MRRRTEASASDFASPPIASGKLSGLGAGGSLSTPPRAVPNAERSQPNFALKWALLGLTAVMYAVGLEDNESMSEYLLFVDDSGNREYDDQRNYETSGRTRYFVYGAILATADEISRFAIRIQELKRTIVGERGIELKSNWLRIPRERQRRYIEPFHIQESDITTLSEGAHRLISAASVELLGAIVDKLHMQEDYREPWYPPTAAYEILLQRAVQAVPTNSTLAVTVDDIGGGTGHHQYKELLRRHHDQLRQKGSTLQRSISFSCLKGPVRFMFSQDSDALQAADLVAYDVHRQFREYGQAWETKRADRDPLPMYPYFRTICSKFRKDETGRIQGFGIVKFPLRQRVHWTLTPGTT